ncbi:MAG: aminopeptidase P family protein [Nitrospiraceae bacterium]|nr:aminopeptidase P family protein [Nitrospiraceae bacterium]
MKERGGQSTRLARLRRLMRERRISALLVTQREHVRYLSGFTGSSGWVLVTPARCVLVTDFRYQLQAKREAPATSLVIQKKDIITTVRETARTLGLRSLCFDEASLTADRINAFRKQGLGMKDVKDPLTDLRQRKDAEELGAIRLAVKRAETSFLELRPHIRPGVTERELALRLEWLMREKGAKRAAFDIIVASGGNGAMPHASVSNRRLRSGDLVTIDFGAEAKGYYCDITRTVCAGKPSARQREIHGLVLRAQQQAIERVAPGVACADADKAARDIIAAAGHGGEFGHATGHGIGLMVHEAPSLSALSKATLAPGMVVTVEPGVYIPGWGGVRIEDMVLVTERGRKLLTSLPRGL